MIVNIIKNYVKTKPRLYDLLDSLRPIKPGVQKWLDNFSKASRKKISFIQIGASDGLRWDPIRRFVVRDGWNGIFVEPLPYVFNVLKNNYAYIKNQEFIFVNAAISSENDRYTNIWSYSDEFCNSLALEDRLFYLRKSSFDKKFVEDYAKSFDNIKNKIKSFRVQCLTVSSLLEKYWSNKKIDIICIDAEGHDGEIIKGIDFEIIHPQAILFEVVNLGDRKQEIYNLFSQKGYKVLEFSTDAIAASGNKS